MAGFFGWLGAAPSGDDDLFAPPEPPRPSKPSGASKPGAPPARAPFVVITAPKPYRAELVVDATAPETRVRLLGPTSDAPWATIVTRLDLTWIESADVCTGARLRLDHPATHTVYSSAGAGAFTYPLPMMPIVRDVREVLFQRDAESIPTDTLQSLAVHGGYATCADGIAALDGPRWPLYVRSWMAWMGATARPTPATLAEWAPAIDERLAALRRPHIFVHDVQGTLLLPGACAERPCRVRLLFTVLATSISLQPQGPP